MNTSFQTRRAFPNCPDTQSSMPTAAVAHDIVRERPSLVGLSDGFQIVDELEASRMRNRVVDDWSRASPGRVIDGLLALEVLETHAPLPTLVRLQPAAAPAPGRRLPLADRS